MSWKHHCFFHSFLNFSDNLLQNNIFGFFFMGEWRSQDNLSYLRKKELCKTWRCSGSEMRAPILDILYFAIYLLEGFTGNVDNLSGQSNFDFQWVSRNLKIIESLEGISIFIVADDEKLRLRDTVLPLQE